MDLVNVKTSEQELQANRQSINIESFHVHVYFDPETRIVAERIRQELAEEFHLQPGRLHTGPVGPHTKAMFGVTIVPEDITKVVAWLRQNHAGLSVLVHPESGDVLGDHTERALWLGRQLELKTEAL
jgi:aromatic ring-cleaving dioxygenase